MGASLKLSDMSSESVTGAALSLEQLSDQNEITRTLPLIRLNAPIYSLHGRVGFCQALIREQQVRKFSFWIIQGSHFGLT